MAALSDDIQVLYRDENICLLKLGASSTGISQPNDCGKGFRSCKKFVSDVDLAVLARTDQDLLANLKKALERDDIRHLVSNKKTLIDALAACTYALREAFKAKVIADGYRITVSPICLHIYIYICLLNEKKIIFIAFIVFYLGLLSSKLQCHDESMHDQDHTRARRTSSI
jgi:hypothetical protein